MAMVAVLAVASEQLPMSPKAFRLKVLMRQACFNGLCAPHPHQGHAPAGRASPSLDPAAGRDTVIASAYQLAAVIFEKSKFQKIF